MSFKGLPADIITVPGWANLCERFPGEQPTYAGHIAGLISSQYVLEALWRVVTRPWEKFQADHEELEVWRLKTITMEQAQAIADRAVDLFSGKSYAWWKIGLHLADWLFAWGTFGVTWVGTAGLKPYKGEPHMFRKLIVTDAPVCHFVWAEAYDCVAGYRFGVEPHEVDPDQMHDWMKAHPEEWELVYQRKAS